MSDTYIVLIISTVLGLVQAGFWKWVQNISDERKADRAKIDRLDQDLGELRTKIAESYQSKADSHKDTERVMNALGRIENQIDKLSEKLDKKADK